jgi:hypothetical protein
MLGLVYFKIVSKILFFALELTKEVDISKNLIETVRKLMVSI